MAKDAQEEWDEYLRRSLGEIDAAYTAHASGLVLPVQVTPPPTRAETIKHAWSVVRTMWDRESRDGEMLVEHDLGIVPPMLFQRFVYDGQAVIEAEGVVVERLASRK